ncbi:MAG: MnmC family methyltransferase [Cyanobacteria bacterium P01_H01_bin.15]
MINLPAFAPQRTSDGSFTFFSEEFGETFHSRYGARAEAEQTYCQACGLPELAAKQARIILIDVCYGLGYNSAAALASIWDINPRCQIELWGLELNPKVPQSACQNGLLGDWSDPISASLTQLARTGVVQTPHLTARLLYGDARQTITIGVPEKLQADAIFLDPFSPPKCPQLWSVEFISLVVSHLQPQGRLATYSCAGAVRSSLQQAGLHIGAIANVGRKAPGTLASWDASLVQPLSPVEQDHLRTKAAIPYRDPSLRGTAADILARRDQEKAQSSLESTTRWKKRWFPKGGTALTL